MSTVDPFATLDASPPFALDPEPSITKPTRKRTPRSPTVTAPFTVVIDTREQAPFSFQGMTADANKQHKPLVVPVEFRGLSTGDYSVAGLENFICIERKSAADLYSTLGQGRDRFEREHERMKEMVARGGWCAVVVEAGMNALLTQPPAGSRLNPKTVFRTSIAWQQRYGVPWVFLDGRRLAEVWTYRSLERFWMDLKEGKN